MWRNLLLSGTVLILLLTGAPYRPEKIEELLRSANQPKIVHVLREEQQVDDD